MLNLTSYLSNLDKKLLRNILFMRHNKLNLISPSNCMVLQNIWWKMYKRSLEILTIHVCLAYFFLMIRLFAFVWRGLVIKHCVHFLYIYIYIYIYICINLQVNILAFYHMIVAKHNWWFLLCPCILSISYNSLVPQQIEIQLHMTPLIN